MITVSLLALLLPSVAHAGGQVKLEALAGGRTAPQVSAQGAGELGDTEAPVGLGALRVDAESAASKGAWLGITGESWSYLPDPELSLLRLEPRAGWHPHVGEVWRVDMGTRYALEAYPYSPRLSSGRGEATATVGPTLGALRAGLLGTYVRRDFFGADEWSFETAEGGGLLGTAPASGGVRATATLTGQFNAGSTLDAAGVQHPATGTQLRSSADLGWTRRTVDLSLGWRFIRSWEGNVEDAARPQFTPIGQYADDADALSAGGFVQNRVDLSVAWLPSAAWTLGLDGMLRLRSSEDGQASASLATTQHLQGRAERRMSESWQLFGALGMTRVDLVTGDSGLDLYGWMGLRWAPLGKAEAARADALPREAAPSRP